MKFREVSQDASSITEIRAVYRKAVQEWHPDRNIDPKAEAKGKINQTYETLKQPSKRSHQDNHFPNNNNSSWGNAPFRNNNRRNFNFI